MEHEGTTREELIAEQASLNEQFEAYKDVLSEIYKEMYELSTRYNTITSILEGMDGQEIHNQQG